MSLLDMRTVLFSYVISNLICMIFMAVLWFQSRRWFAGTGFWLARYILQWAGVLLIALRGQLPDFFSMAIGNTMVAAGSLMLLIGMQRFVKKPGPQIHNFVFLSFFFLVYSYFTVIAPSMNARSFLLAVAIIVFSAQTAWLSLRQVDQELAALTRGVGITSVLFCIDSLGMIWYDVALPLNNDLMQIDSSGTLLILITQMLSLVLAFSLFLMVSRRLMDDLFEDIARRKQAETNLRQSGEKFSKAFNSSPDAISISRLKDGQLIDVNDGFTRIFGIPRQEALAGSTINLGIWKNLSDWDQLVAGLNRFPQVQSQVYEFRNQAGQTIYGLYSGDLISLNGEDHILSTMRDITEITQSKKLVQKRLDLWEYALTHSLEEVIQKALDEIDELTASPIGFYHLVDEDQNTLILKAWSTRAREEFCIAEGEGTHYPISQAGVWGDCVTQRKSVIHNNYAPLPNKKGLPDRHALLVRELVVPTIHENRVVAILGVGNKATEYTERDVELVSYIADVTWMIVDHRNAMDQIQQLNIRLEHLAMSDALTELLNRRAFFERGEIEIKQVQRYQTNLSLLMLDIDHFKQVNDTYGHNCGDLVLQGVTKILLATIRETDIAARLGGEEFAVLLPNTAIADAFKLGERIRQAIEQFDVFQDGNSGADRNLCVTVSIGVATCSPDLTLDSMLCLADQAMYQAKHLGRNRVAYLEA